MKIRQTLVFMFKNSTPIFLYFLLCWVLFSALTTIADDPFLYGTLPDAADEVREVSKGLPWSLWKLCTAVSLMIQEIARDLSYEGFWLIIGSALFIGYLEARGSINGLEDKRTAWMTWYNKQNEIKVDGDSDVKPQMSENILDASIPKYSPGPTQLGLSFVKQLIFHFAYWIAAFVLLNFILHLNRGIGETIQLFIEHPIRFLAPAVVLALFSNYRMSRGYLKGIAAEQDVWTNWHNDQKALIADGDNLRGTTIIGPSYVWILF